ncbi:MAG TPA: hypothetical protein VK151_15285 [Fluviicola sp.]|nr:hypothetical protein [Fluviicola sp.]
MKTLLLKPFERYSEKQLLLIGFLAFAVGIVLAKLFNTHFDGVLDTHFSDNVSWAQSAFNNSVNVIVLTLMLFLAGKIINRKTRLVDLLAAVLIARIPFYPLVFCNIGNKAFSSGDQILKSMQYQTSIPASTIVLLVVIVVITLALLVWSISLLYNGYKVAVNGKGAKAVVLFIVAVFIAEIVSKLVIFLGTNTIK